jgi:WD40 repeat protein
MASTFRQPAPASTKMILTPVVNLEGHRSIELMSYFPDGRHMVSGRHDKTIRLWDLHAGNLEIEEVRDNCGHKINAVEVFQKDGRWVVTAGRDSMNQREPKAYEVETGPALIYPRTTRYLPVYQMISQGEYGAWTLANSWLVHWKILR